jgi:hypothetical protein
LAVRSSAIAWLLALSACDRVFELTSVVGIDGSIQRDGSAENVCFTEAFETPLFVAVWGVFDRPAATAEVTLGALEIELGPSTATDNYAGIISQQQFDFTDASVEVELLRPATLADGTETIFELTMGSDQLQFNIDGNQLYFQRYIEPGPSDVGTGPMTFSADHRYLQFRHVASRSVIEFSTADIGRNWKVRRTLDATNLAVTATRIVLYAGTYVSVAATTSASFDNLIMTCP